MLSADSMPQFRAHNTALSSHSSTHSSPRSHGPEISMKGVPTHHQATKHIWLVTGPAGCGKTTIAQYLAKELSLPYVEGDDYHSDANRLKMASNIPLTDEDRWNWLIVLRNEAIKQLETSDGVMVTCSALKHKYRDVLRIAHYEHPSVQIHFIYLRADRKTLQDRVAKRKGHYMKKEMVNSQFDNLEEPEAVEWDAMSVDVRSPPEEVQHTALEVVKKKLAEYQDYT